MRRCLVCVISSVETTAEAVTITIGGACIAEPLPARRGGVKEALNENIEQDQHSDCDSGIGGSAGGGLNACERVMNMTKSL